MNVGNIIYQHGLAILTKQDIGGNSPSDFVGAANVTCSFSSSFDIYETQYKATINEFEYNFSLNPSIISGSTDGTVYDFVTGSYFLPYATTVGLYDNDQNLLAVGKLSVPTKVPMNSDLEIQVAFDSI